MTGSGSREAAADARRRTEELISILLRTGVVTSLALVAVGTVLSFLHHPGYAGSAADLARLTRPGAAFPRSLPDIQRELRHLSGQAIITLGLLVLMATPVLRVAVSILLFYRERDRKFVVITSVVLALLLTSLLLGRAGG